MLQPHERDALLSGPLSDVVRISNEQDRAEWSNSNTPKSSDPQIHKKPAGRSKHPSGSNVSFSKDIEGGDEEPTQVMKDGPLLAHCLRFMQERMPIWVSAEQ